MLATTHLAYVKIVRRHCYIINCDLYDFLTNQSNKPKQKSIWTENSMQ